jgi:hypothetical protein
MGCESFAQGIRIASIGVVPWLMCITFSLGLYIGGSASGWLVATAVVWPFGVIVACELCRGRSGVGARALHRRR